MPECSVKLIQLHIATGQLSAAITEVMQSLTIEKKNRQMLNFFRVWDCDVPAVAFEVFGYRQALNPASMTDEDAKYMYLLVRETPLS